MQNSLLSDVLPNYLHATKILREVYVNLIDILTTFNIKLQLIVHLPMFFHSLMMLQGNEQNRSNFISMGDIFHVLDDDLK